MHVCLNKKNFKSSTNHLLNLRNSKNDNVLKKFKNVFKKELIKYNYINRLNIEKIDKNRLDSQQNCFF